MGTQPGDGIDGAQYRNPRLELGAADYIVKPFSPMELVARVRAALSRRSESEPCVSGELRIRDDLREVTVASRRVALTTTSAGCLSHGQDGRPVRPRRLAAPDAVLADPAEPGALPIR